MDTAKDTKKVFKQYADYIQEEASNMVSEPSAIYASAFDDMLTVTSYDKDFAADLLDVSYKTVSRYQRIKRNLALYKANMF